MGFLDATPIKPGVLHDVVWSRGSEPKALAVAEAYWQQYATTYRATKGLIGVVHCAFLSQMPRLLDFERFIYLYTAFDGCHAIRCAKKGLNAKSGGHRERIDKLCLEVGRTTPDWADPNSNKIVPERNDTLHEGLFFDEPWGFQVYGGNANAGAPRRNILLEMRCLLCRLIFGIVGFNDPVYIQSPVDTRQQHGVKL
jgi:hypothetical protein